MTRRLIPRLAAFNPALIIFDKDGTLIDFDTMWVGWVTELARRLEAAASLPLTDHLLHAMGVDPESRRVAPEGPLAVATMADLRALAVEVVCQAGLPRPMSEATVSAVWHLLDPVALARPLADLPALFSALRGYRVKIAIATTDDRASTEATLAQLDVAFLVDALVCGDDGVPVKPAPDMVWAVCRATGVTPTRAVVVGDTVADLQMGRAAGAGLIVGVLSGVSPAAALAPHADVLLPSIAELMEDGQG